MFKIMKGKLIQATNAWEKYLEGKTLILCTGLAGTINLCGIEGEENLDGLCEHCWNVELEHEYDNIEDFKEEVSLGNDGFGFHKGEIEILEMLVQHDLNASNLTFQSEEA